MIVHRQLRKDLVRISNPYVLHTELAEETGIEEVDDFLYCLVNVLQLGVGDFLRSVFLIGSYAHGGHAPGSDLDCCFIWKQGADRDVIRKGSSLVAHLNRISRHTVDPMYDATETPFYDSALHDDPAVGNCPCGPILKLAVREHSLLLWGQDIRPRIAVSPGPAMLDDALAAPLNWIRQTHFGSMDAAIVYPLADPAPETEDLGYGDLDKAAVRVLHIARVLAFLETGEFLFDKRQVPEAYGKHVGGPWSEWIRDVFNARQGAASRKQARAAHLSACRRLTAFQNHFLETLAAKGLEPGRFLRQEG